MVNTLSKSGLVESKSLQKKMMAQIESLPSLSTVVGEFLELSSRECFTAMDFERVLIKDQALVARLLKVANSSFFASSRQIDSVHEAVVLIGMDNMRNIVYAVSSSGLLRREMKCYRYPERGFWLHSMAVGMSCRALAEALKKPPVRAEEAFVAGLLHDIGKLILDDFLAAEPGPRQVTLDEERETASLDHPELGERILERWKIPTGIRHALRYHHDYKESGEIKPAGALVHLADAICNHWGLGTRSMVDLGAEIDAARYAEILTALGLGESAFRNLLWELRQKLAVVEKYYIEGA